MRMTETIAAWLVTYAVHSTLLLGGAWLVTRAVRSVAAREIIWKGAMVGALVTASVQLLAKPSHLTLADLARRVAPPSGVAARRLEREEAGFVAPGGTIVRWRVERLTGEPHAPARWLAVVLAGGWLLGGGGSVAWRLARRGAARRRLGARRPSVDRELILTVEHIRRRARLASPVLVTTSPRLLVPAALGTGEICLPEDALAALSPAQQESILAHEVAHLRRHDPLWLEAAELLSALFFFQPLNRLARAALKEAAEFLCDDAAVRSTGAQRPLAESLAALAATLADAPAVSGVAFAERASTLVRRVHRVLHGGEPAPSSWTRARALTITGALLALIAAFAPGLSARPPEGRPVTGPLPPGIAMTRKMVVLRLDTATRGAERRGRAAVRIPLLAPPASQPARPVRRRTRPTPV